MACAESHRRGIGRRDRGLTAAMAMYHRADPDSVIHLEESQMKKHWLGILIAGALAGCGGDKPAWYRDRWVVSVPQYVSVKRKQAARTPLCARKAFPSSPTLKAGRLLCARLSSRVDLKRYSHADDRGLDGF